MTKDDLLVENKHLRDQLLGTRLLAMEMQDHFDTVTHELAKRSKEQSFSGDFANAICTLQKHINTLRGDRS